MRTIRRMTIGASMLTALMLVAGGAAAQGGLGDLYGAGDAAGGLAGSYEVDGTGAYDAAADTSGDGHSRLVSAYDEAMFDSDQAEQHVLGQMEAQAEPDLPDPDLPVDTVNTVDAAHDDRLDKSLDAETGLVDANADVSAWGSVKAFFSGIADVAGGAVDAVKGLLGADYETQDRTDAAADALFDARGDVRSEVDGLVHSDADVPELEPRLSGEYAFEHAGSASSDVIGGIQLP